MVSRPLKKQTKFVLGWNDQMAKKKRQKSLLCKNYKLNFKCCTFCLAKAQKICIIWPDISTEVFLTSHYSSFFLVKFLTENFAPGTTPTLFLPNFQ